MYKILDLTKGTFLTGNNFYFGIQHISSAYKSCPGNYTWEDVYKHNDMEPLEFTEIRQAQVFAMYYILRTKSRIPEEFLITDETINYSGPIIDVVYV